MKRGNCTMRRILTIAALLLTLIVSSLNPAYADETAAKVYDTAAQLLTGTGNVTLTGNATFSLDGEAFKFVETTYIQDGVNSKWVLNLSSPRADGSLRENGFTAIANNRWKYGMEVFHPGFYTVAEDDPQSVILRPSAELAQITALGHALLEQLPTFPEDVFSLSEGKHLSIRLENEHISGSVSNLLSLATWLAVQRTMNIVDDSIAAPPYPEEAVTMDDYITPTQAIVNSTEKYELIQLSINAEMDEAGRFTEANGTARIILRTFLEGDHELHISFAGKVSDYGTSTVAVFDPKEYGVAPAEGTLPSEQESAESEAGAGKGGSEEIRNAESRGNVYYINPEGGSKYHYDQNCPSVNPRFLPLSVSITTDDLKKEPYSQLSPCSICVYSEDNTDRSEPSLPPLAWYENRAEAIFEEAGFDHGLMENVEAGYDDGDVIVTLSNADNSFFAYCMMDVDGNLQEFRHKTNPWREEEIVREREDITNDIVEECCIKLNQYMETIQPGLSSRINGYLLDAIFQKNEETFVRLEDPSTQSIFIVRIMPTWRIDVLHFPKSNG